MAQAKGRDRGRGGERTYLFAITGENLRVYAGIRGARRLIKGGR